MEKEIVQAYSTRITQANRSELVVITYEIILEELKAARVAWNNQDIINFETELKRAQKFLNELMGSLDYQYNLSQQLLALYKYVNEQVIIAIARRTDETLAFAEDVLKGLLVGFQEVSKQDNSKPLMENTQRLYAGLTYGKGSLNETFVDVNQTKRGFQA